MKNPNSEPNKVRSKKKKEAKLISLDLNNNLNSETEYEKYYNRIKMLSRGM
ncbi:MAG: hypothetical protein L3J34_10180 [Flavobacteriaceae bacterium]|nr:hypothetical protein [Flavobacteriaceae bacterium]